MQVHCVSFEPFRVHIGAQHKFPFWDLIIFWSRFARINNSIQNKQIAHGLIREDRIFDPRGSSPFLARTALDGSDFLILGDLAVYNKNSSPLFWSPGLICEDQKSDPRGSNPLLVCTA
jgi:hypothetical protein